jgi:hypothetical protein
MHKGIKYATQYPTYFSRTVVIRADSPPTFTILDIKVSTASDVEARQVRKEIPIVYIVDVLDREFSICNDLPSVL